MHHHYTTIQEMGTTLMTWIGLLGVAHELGLPYILLVLVCKLLDLIWAPVRAVKGHPSSQATNDTSEEEEDPSWAVYEDEVEPPPYVEEFYASICSDTELELTNAKRQIATLQTHLDWLLAQREAEQQELIQVRFQVRALQQKLTTTEDVPEGKLLIRGRLVVGAKHLAIIPTNGKPFRVHTTIGWEYPGETGDLVLLEALMQEQGWTAWRVIVEQPGSQLPALDQNLVEKLSATKDKQEKKTPDFNQLDLEAAQNSTRTASHSKTAITLHIVLPTHARFSLTQEQADDLKQIVTGLIEELDMGIVSAIEVGHTKNGNQRDHLHLLVSAFNHTGDSIGKQVGRLKALSSGRLRRKHPSLPEKLWSASYWVSSAGGSLDKVQAYIEGNADKHLDED